MKRIKWGVLLLLIAMLGTGCQSVPPAEEQNITEEKQNLQKVDQKDEAKAEEKQNEEKPEKLEMKVYYSSDDAEEILQKTVSVYRVDAETVWEQLVAEGVVVQDSRPISCEKKEDGILVLDLDEVFGESLRKMGTAEESCVIRCITNTFLDAFKCEKLMITENGGLLCSGHREYDDYLVKR